MIKGTKLDFYSVASPSPFANRQITSPYDDDDNDDDFYHPLLVKPLTCFAGNWWDSFDREGWSNCSNNNLFITGFFRSHHSRRGHLIYLLEYARCCSSIPAFKGQNGNCKIAIWATSLDRYSSI